MSVSNLISGAAIQKPWSDLKVQNLDVRDLNVSNFTIGAIESGTWNPVVANPTGGCLGLTSGLKVEARYRKINNLVQFYVAFDFNPASTSAGDFAITNLPVAKTSNWVIGDSVYGSGTVHKVGDTSLFLGLVVPTSDPEDDTTQSITCFCSEFVDTAPHRIVFEGRYTTD